jgi:DNA-binding winged helix-turn-helix (wHTH) protein
MPEAVLRFGPFELDLETVELRRAGRRVRLPLQPARVLCLLATRHGHLVTREEIRAHLWGAETFVDADLGLNYCVNAIRSALRDSARAPRYVETLPRRGYRFIAPLSGDGTPPPETPEPRPVRPEAREAFLHAERLLREEMPLGGRILPSAERLFEEAVRLDPEYATAWGALAGNRAWQAFLGLRPYPELLGGARDAANRALALDETVAKAWGALGVVSLYFDWDFGAAKQLLERALTLAPHDPGVRHAYSDYFVVMGRVEESLEEVLLACEQNPGSWHARVFLPGHYVAARRYPEAIREAESLLASFPGARNARHFLARSLWMTGRFEGAVSELGRLWGASSEAARVLEFSWREAGPRAAMKALADHLAGRADAPTGNATEVAACYAICGEPGAAFAWLERAFERRAPGLLHVPVDPFFDPIRADPRIDDLCRRVGLPVEAWRGLPAPPPPPIEPA